MGGALKSTPEKAYREKKKEKKKHKESSSKMGYLKVTNSMQSLFAALGEWRPQCSYCCKAGMCVWNSGWRYVLASKLSKMSTGH